jgi:hypothetical protein
MDQDTLVNNQIDDGEAFIRDYSDYVPIVAAFWVKPAESESWYLYIASAEINDGNLRERYREVLRRVGSQKYVWLDALHVKLINSEDSLAREVKKIRDQTAPALPVRYNLASIAGLPTDGCYIYPETVYSQPTP